MGSITTGVGLVSGIDIAGLIDSLISLESQGKLRLQQRISELQSQQTSLLDINARLLNFKNASGAFRSNSIFQSALATSSNPDVLAATATSSAQPGTFSFIVKQLVSSSQLMSQGYATADASPLGLDSMSFEFGRGRVVPDRALEDLNGGAGVDRGRITIKDGTGATATIDLTDVTNLDEVLERINTADGIQVTATVDDDHLVLTDTSGGGGLLTVSDVGSHTTATDLGIAGSGIGGVITGSSIFFIGPNTALATLNDGNGVLIRDNVDDIVITPRDNVSFSVDFGRLDLPIDDATLLEDLNNGAGITLNDDSEDPDIKFITRQGTEHEVDLTGVTTVGQLKARIATATGGDIQVEVHAGGDRFTVTDTTGDGPSLLEVQGAGANGDDTAEDLGILKQDIDDDGTFDGDMVPNAVDDPAATTIQDIIDRINNDDENAGRIVASIAPDGHSIQLEDMTGASVVPLSVAATAGNPSAAEDLGLIVLAAGSILDGDRLLGGLDSVLVRSLNGGAGLGLTTTVTINDRAGAEVTTTVGSFETLQQIIEDINAKAADEDVQVTVGLNETGNGLKVVDTSGGGGNLTISGTAAPELGIEADVAEDVVRGSNLQLQYVGHAVKLDSLNDGSGISTGSFRITDGLGQTATINIGGTETTLYDVILEINAQGIAVNARVNDNGDGLIIEEDPAGLGGQSPFVNIKVESVNGTTAADLNILGEAEDLIGGFIDGSYERVVDLSLSDSLNDIVSKINDAGIPVSASVINTGSGAQPYRLSLASGITGRAGDLVVDLFGGEIGLSTLSRGEDAKVFFGSENPEDGFLIASSTNTIENVIGGVTIDLLQASADPVTLTVGRDVDAIVEAVRSFATTFNDVVGRLDQYDFYDVETEERGVLLGDPTVGRVRSALYRIASGSAMNVGGSYQSLFQIGITFNSEGEMTFDDNAFREAYASDPESMEKLFAEYDVAAGGTEEVAPGVTIESADLTFNALGFGELFSNLLDQLTNSINGTLTLADDAFEDQIGLLESRIETIDDRLDARRDQLLKEFTAMEEVLAQLQTQSAALAGLANNVSFSANLLSGIG